MAVTHDAANEATYTTTSPATVTLTPSGVPRGVGVCIVVNANEEPATAVTVNGVDMGAAAVSATDSAGEPGRAYIWFLGESITAGDQQISITHAGSATTKYVSVFSVAADRNVEVVATGTDTADQANPSIALDSGAKSALRYGAIFSGLDSVGSLTPGAGMSTVNDHDFGTQVARVDRQTTASTGSFTVQYTAASDDVAYAAIAIAELTSTFNEDVDVWVEAGFGYGPYDTPGWTDITTYVRDMSFDRGRDHELDTIQAGTASFLLDNRTGDFNANNTAGAFYPNVKPMVPIRLLAMHNNGVTDIVYPLWYGYVDGWPVSFPGMKDVVAAVTATDLFKILALTDASDSLGRRNTVVDSLSPDAFWRFTGTGTADSSGNAHTLTFTGTPTTGVAGAWTDDEAVTLDGSTEEATVASEATLEYVDASMSIECWINQDSSAAFYEVASSSAAANFSWGLAISSNVIQWAPFITVDAHGTLTGGTLTPNEWEHVVVTRSVSGGTSTIRAYLNGVLIDTIATTVVAGAAARTVYIGRSTDGDRFAGSISEVTLYDYVLTPSQVSKLYNAQSDNFVSQLTSERVSDLLTAAGFTDNDIETGQTTMQSTSIDGSLLDQIQAAVETEAGLFYINPQGQPRFEDRHWRILDQIVPNATFQDPDYNDIALSYDDSNIWNEIVAYPGNAADTSPFIVTDADSINDYGKRTFTFTVFPEDQNEAFDRANWALGLYADPAIRFPILNIPPLSEPDVLWPEVLAAEISNRYAINRQLPGDNFGEEVYLEKISMQIGLKDWQVQFQFSPAAQVADFWLLGEAGFSELGETTILGY